MPRSTVHHDIDICGAAYGNDNSEHYFLQIMSNELDSFSVRKSRDQIYEFGLSAKVIRYEKEKEVQAKEREVQSKAKEV